MSDEWKAFMAIGESFAKHETVKHSSGEYVREPSTSISTPASAVPSPASFIISGRSMPTYFHEIGFRWSQRVIRKTRHGQESVRTLWSRVPPALQLMNVFRTATGRQMRRSPDGGIIVKSAVAVFG